MHPKSKLTFTGYISRKSFTASTTETWGMLLAPLRIIWTWILRALSTGPNFKTSRRFFDLLRRYNWSLVPSNLTKPFPSQTTLELWNMVTSFDFTGSRHCNCISCPRTFWRGLKKKCNQLPIRLLLTPRRFVTGQSRLDQFWFPTLKTRPPNTKLVLCLFVPLIRHCYCRIVAIRNA